MLDRLDDPVAPQPAAGGWVSARLLRTAMQFLASRGLDPADALQAAGMEIHLLHDLDGQVPLLQVERLLVVVRRQLALSSLGIEMARSGCPASFEVLGHLFMASSTLGGLLETIVRYNGLMSHFGWTELRHGPGTVTLSRRAPGRGADPAARGRRVRDGCLPGALSMVLAPRLPPAVTVRLRHEDGDPAVHDELRRFFGCPVHLGQPENAIVLPAAWMKIRLPHGDDELSLLLHQRAQCLLASHSRRPCVVAQACQHIAQAMKSKGPPSRTAVARRMGCSESTLHRRLRAQGTSFQALVDEQRLSLAQQSLADGAPRVSEISQQLGFSSPQVFSR